MSAVGRIVTRACAAAALTLPLTAGAVAAPIPPAVTRHLTLPYGRIAYDDTGGSGPLVLAIPGMGDLRSEYRALRPLLWRAGYRVVTMDIRGHGDSSVAWDDYSARAVGRDALELIRHLQAGPAVILGNSFAAGSALWAAHEMPAQVRGVVLLGPVVRDGEPPWWARAAVAANLREPGRMAALRTMVDLSKADTEAIVGRSRVPALVVMGTRDSDFPDPVAEARWLGEQLGAAPVLVEGAGHYPHLEVPEQVAPALLAFLARTAPLR